MALTPKARFVHKNQGVPIYETQLLTLSADVGPVDLNASLVGGALFSVELFASTDDAFTFTIQSGIGTKLVEHTTSGATAGEFATIGDRYTINSIPNYTLADLAGGTVTIEIVVWKN